MHPNYPGCNRLRTVSKDELSSLFCETPSSWGDRQTTPCSSFVKGLRFLNTVMTFILHPLSHYNSITEPCARFLLSLLEDISIDFPSHFFLSLIDDFRDTATRGRLIFPLAITRILRHFSVSFPKVAPDKDDNSSSFYRSIHLRSFIFYGWSDSWGHQGTVCVHGCSP